MASSCPQCGWSPVGGAHCPRCGVDVARYRADLAAASAMPAPALRPLDRPVAPSASPGTSTHAPTPSTWATTAEPPRIPPPAPPAAFAPPASGSAPGAVLLDVILVMLAEMAFGFLLWAVTDDRLAAAASRAFRFLASPCYFVFLHWARGQTLGKMVFRIRVVMLNGAPLPFGLSLLRHLGSWISARHPRHRVPDRGLPRGQAGLHDLIAGTRVEHLA